MERKRNYQMQNLLRVINVVKLTKNVVQAKCNTSLKAQNVQRH
jgi:hypothetical protein